MPDVSLRALTIALERQGVATASGTGRWSVKQVRNLLRQPKYCGLGRGLRYRTDHAQEQDRETRLVRDQRHIHDRMRDPAEWHSETFAIPPSVIPRWSMRSSGGGCRPN